MQKYFAAANTANGFVGWFDDIFDPRTLDFTYIIKGGSGTGKSTLMKKVATKAVKDGAECEYYYCSSDPTSLDGIIVRLTDGRKLALLDGTAPHMRDPKFPGAAEEIVNLGEFWCDDILKGQRDEIVSLCDKKAKLFAQAYADFSAAGTLVSAQLDEVKSAVLTYKLDAACERLLTQRMRECRIKGGTPHSHVRALSALSTHGEVYFDSFSDCEKVCLTVDSLGTTPLLFEAMLSAAKRLGLDVDRAPMPLLPNLTEAVRFPQLSMSVVSRTDRQDVKPINMTRFVDRDALCDSARSRRRTLKKAVHELTEAGLEKLAVVREVHAKVEKIYIGAMDFTRLGSATERLLGRIFA